MPPLRASVHAARAASRPRMGAPYYRGHWPAERNHADESASQRAPSGAYRVQTVPSTEPCHGKLDIQPLMMPSRVSVLISSRLCDQSALSQRCCQKPNAVKTSHLLKMSPFFTRFAGPQTSLMLTRGRPG